MTRKLLSKSSKDNDKPHPPATRASSSGAQQDRGALSYHSIGRVKLGISFEPEVHSTKNKMDCKENGGGSGSSHKKELADIRYEQDDEQEN